MVMTVAQLCEHTQSHLGGVLFEMAELCGE